jgi:hypothetical protein
MPSLPTLPEPQASPPVLFGERTASATLPWTWAAERLAGARNYWVAAVRADGRPLVRPLWAVWLADGLWFTTGSQMIRSLPTHPQVSVNLEDGSAALILEGVAEQIGAYADLTRFVAAYNRKYEHSARVSDVSGGEIADAEGPIGPAFRVRPRLVYGWRSDMQNPTRWTFPPAPTP